jgi:hypothetical protein
VILTCTDTSPSKRVVGLQLRHIKGRALSALRRLDDVLPAGVSHLSSSFPQIRETGGQPWTPEVAMSP